MTSRERVIKALRFDHPDRAPRDLWALPITMSVRKPEVDRLCERYPMDIEYPVVSYGQSKRAEGTPGKVGTHRDAWGSVWHVAEPGVTGEVKRPAISEWSQLGGYALPWEILDEADFSGVNKICAATDKFVLGATQVCPFERMQFIRGVENLMMDLLYQPKELLQLRDMVHEYNLRSIKQWAETDVDAISWLDDWGWQNGLLVDPKLWRLLFRPLYQDYCDIVKKAGKFAFYHSDGHIMEIYPDLIDIGIDAVNSQLFCMDIEEIGRRFKGKITFWGEICRQRILPFGTPDEVRAAVRRARRALDDGSGGVFAQCEWGKTNPAGNIAAVYAAWEEPSPNTESDQPV